MWLKISDWKNIYPCVIIHHVIYRVAKHGIKNFSLALFWGYDILLEWSKILLYFNCFPTKNVNSMSQCFKTKFLGFWKDFKILHDHSANKLLHFHGKWGSLDFFPHHRWRKLVLAIYCAAMNSSQFSLKYPDDKKLCSFQKICLKNNCL